MELSVRLEAWPFRRPLRITGYVFTDAHVVVAEVRDGDHVGRGEAVGVLYKGDTPEVMMAALEGVKAAVADGLDRAALQDLLPASGARNALDCALWELDARRAGAPVRELAGVEVRPLVTAYTIGADAPASVAEQATAMTDASAIKLKLLGDEADAERVRLVRARRPDAWLAVDGNRGFNPDSLDALMPVLADADVRLLEQPFPIGSEAWLDGLKAPMPVAADESVQTIDDLEAMVGRFDVINIKLDKCGGLTHALAMAREIKRLGMQVMVGNMVGTSWAMAPAFLVGQFCDVVDLDGPMFLKSDREPAVVYEGGRIFVPDAVWG